MLLEEIKKAEEITKEVDNKLNKKRPNAIAQQMLELLNEGNDNTLEARKLLTGANNTEKIAAARLDRSLELHHVLPEEISEQEIKRDFETK